MLKLEIVRQYSEGCTSGYLLVDGNTVCYTLERPWADNINNISAIPAGQYSAKLRYDHNDHWRFELQGVPHRDNVQIHIGNTLDDTQGCILLGASLGPDLCSVNNSQAAYKAFKKACYGSSDPADLPEVGAIVIVRDAG